MCSEIQMSCLNTRLLEYTGWSHAMQPTMYDVSEVLINIQFTVMGSRHILWLNTAKNTNYIKKGFK